MTLQGLEPENPLQALLRARVRSAISSAKTAAVITHPGLKGDFLEILISQLFRPLLPADIGLGSGQIVDSHSGKLSTQIDIVLFDKSILPPILADERHGLFPIESVLYAIEVKTTLTREGLATAHRN